MTLEQLNAYLASKTDSWLHIEFDQATAMANDLNRPSQDREEALAAAYAISGEIIRRKAASES